MLSLLTQTYPNRILAYFVGNQLPKQGWTYAEPLQAVIPLLEKVSDPGIAVCMISFQPSVHFFIMLVWYSLAAVASSFGHEVLLH